jgi:ABC-2 type transport system ATP-binding protein
MRELLRELKTMGKTIFFSSHILSEVAEICTSIGIIDNGRLVASGRMEEMMRQIRAHRLIEVRYLAGGEWDESGIRRRLTTEIGVLSVVTSESAGLPPGSLRFDYNGDDAALAHLLGKLIGDGIPVLAFGEVSGDLEDVFLQVTRETNG